MTAPAMTLSPPLTISLLGPMQVLLDGRPMRPPHSRKALWLLALLTLRPHRSVEREWLAATLWPDMEQSQALSNLRRILSELRTALEKEGGRLQSPSRHTLLLDLTDADVDVVTFERAIASRDASALKQAVALYRGALLEGCAEEWVGQERVAREQDCLSVLQRLADSALSDGNDLEAVGYFQKAVGLFPWWDTAQRGLMEALVRVGDTNAALHVYREYAELLKSDPKAVPDEETTALYTRIRAEARRRSQAGAQSVAHVLVAAASAVPASAPAIPGYLPHPLTELVGREDERLEIAARLRRSRLVTLTGLGGIGKTRLAIAVAAEIAREYEDGVWLVALESLQDGRLVVHQAASVLGVKEEAGRPLLQRVSEFLRTKRLLLVLDNCEHLLEASARFVATLLQECAGIRILVTSREVLGITGEAVWAVPALAVPNPMHLPQGHATLQRVLSSYEGVQLFLDRAQAAQMAFQLTETNARMVAEVCFRLEGIPLAIELAAARVKSMTVNQIAARLNDHLGLLLVEKRAVLPRRQTLRATLDWSYGLLSEPERTLLRHLSVFAGGWTQEAVEQVCIGPEEEAGEAFELLTSLVEKSLVVFDDRDSEGRGRYRLLDLVRQYAADRLEASAETEAIRARHRDWLVRLAEEAEPQLKGAEQKVWLTRLEAERDNLRATMAWEGDGQEGVESLLRLVGAFGRYWYIRGHYQDGRTYLERALARDRAGIPTPARAKALSVAGSLAYRQGEFPTAQERFEESLTIRRACGDQQGAAHSLMTLGMVAQALGDLPTARTLLEETLSLQRELADRYSIAMTLGNLGNVAQAQRDYTGAHARYEESLQIQTELGDKYGIAWSLHSLGNIALDQDDCVSAEAYHQESLGLFEALGDRRGIGWSSYKLGSVARILGDYTTAQARYEESLNIFQEIGERHGEAWTVYGLGFVASLWDDPGTAYARFDAAQGLFQQLGDRIGIASSAQKLGDLTYKQGDTTQAHLRFVESLSLFQALGDKERVVESLIGISAVLLQEDAPERATRLLGAVSALRPSLGFLLKQAQQESLEQQGLLAKASLGDTDFAVAWETGQSLTWERAIEQALAASVL